MIAVIFIPNLAEI